MPERLQKIISAAGIASRREAEKLIQAGRVRVNGAAARLGDSADPDADEITVDGMAVRPKENKTYIMLNKPRGYVTTLSDEKGRKTVSELVRGAGTRLYPVGRLDMYSEGLLIMTDDGDTAFKLMHPSHNVGKTYLVTVRCGSLRTGIDKLRALRELDGEPIRGAEVSLESETTDGAVIAITIYEGKNRQVRRMCASAGMKVLRLIRISEGQLCIGDLPSGKWRYLSPDEIKYLHSILK